MFDCLSSEGFDPFEFNKIARKFLSNIPESTDKEADAVQKQKAKIVSVLAQNVYIMYTLTKEQIKNVTTFWKAMASFIASESDETIGKIHVSYSVLERGPTPFRRETRERRTDVSDMPSFFVGSRHVKVWERPRSVMCR